MSGAPSFAHFTDNVTSNSSKVASRPRQPRLHPIRQLLMMNARMHAVFELPTFIIFQVALVDARFLLSFWNFDVNSEILDNCNNGTQDQYTADECGASRSCEYAAFVV
jgi:hypothetical protein